MQNWVSFCNCRKNSVLSIPAFTGGPNIFPFTWKRNVGMDGEKHAKFPDMISYKFFHLFSSKSFLLAYLLAFHKNANQSIHSFQSYTPLTPSTPPAIPSLPTKSNQQPASLRACPSNLAAPPEKPYTSSPAPPSTCVPSPS